MKSGSDMTLELDERDHRILRHLQADSRLTTQEIGERVGMSASSLWRRVKALEEAGVISGYGARVDPRAAGLGFHAILHVRLERQSKALVEAFIAAISRWPEVQDAYATTGDADYHLRVLCADLDAFNAFMERGLFRLEGVAQIRTNLVLRHIKSGPESLALK